MFEKLLNKLQTKVNLFFNKYYPKVVEKTSALQQTTTEECSKLCHKAEETVQTASAVAKIQINMAQKRVEKTAAKMQTQATSKLNKVSDKIHSKYDSVSNMWCDNQHFTFCLIPADGHNIAKTNVKKSHVKYVLTGLASFLVVVSVTIGVLAHFAIQNEAQRQEIAEYKASKQAQEEKIQELQQIAEKNQQQLAYLSKLEDKVRTEMEKTGAELPPKQDVVAYAGKGGPQFGDVSLVNIMLEQEKNIHAQASAKEADLENLLDVIETENYRREVTPSQWPTSGGYISSPFGGRANPFDGYSRDWHPGIDIANDYGAPVYASASGYVERAGWYGGYGRYVRLNHDYGYETAYGHMSSIVVTSGEFVKKGQIIGYVGSSGYSTGPHLHFEVLQYGKQVNPSKLI